MVKQFNKDGVFYPIEDEHARQSIGSLDNLETDNKGSLVAAVNENAQLHQRNEKVIRGIRRKIMAISGFLRKQTKLEDAQERIEKYNTCRVEEAVFETNSPTEKRYVVIRCCGLNMDRTIRFFVGANNVNQYEVCRMAETQFTRTTVYATESTNKTLTEIWIDGVRYETIPDVLFTVGFVFRHLVITFETADTDAVTLTTISVHSRGFTVWETGTRAKTGFISGGYINPIADHGSEMRLFCINNGEKYYMETVKQTGSTVVKAFSFTGGA